MILRLCYRTALALTYLALITPMAVIVTVAFGSSPLFEFPPPGLTLHWFAVFFASSDMMSALIDVSLPIALTTGVLALALGVPAAVACVRYRFPGRELIFSVLNLPLMIPQVLLGVAILLLMIVAGARPSMLWLVLGHTLITLPFVVNTMIASLARVDPSLEEAAMNLGSTRLGAFFRIVVPLVRSGLLAGGLLAFIISFADSNIALFLSGPGAVTLPMYIFSSLTFEAQPDIAAASAVQIGVVAVLLVVLAKVSGLGRQYGR
jgi:putative spermidine/putrescine transport system permease protein